jgi:hypothetical protein
MTPFPEPDERGVAQLLGLVAANRRTPVHADAIAKARADLATLRAEVGPKAWRAGISAALLAATRVRDPLRGNVAAFVAEHARRAAADERRRELDSCKIPASLEPPTSIDSGASLETTGLWLGAVTGSDADPLSAALSDEEAARLLGPDTTTASEPMA